MMRDCLLRIALGLFSLGTHVDILYPFTLEECSPADPKVNFQHSATFCGLHPANKGLRIL
jgi:hypothetical protein